MGTMTMVRESREARPVVSVVWSEAGFDRHAAEMWRQAGWSDAESAARWRAAAPDDRADHLSRVRDAGYSVEQLRNTARRTRQHVAAWAVAILPPADRASRTLRDRPLVAPGLSTDDHGNTIIDVR